MKLNKLSLFWILFLIVSLSLAVWIISNQRFDIRKKAAPPDEIEKVIPLKINEPIYGLSISGKISLNEENSFIRFILLDKDQNEYLIYEAFPLLADTQSFSVDSVCEETCILDAVVPDSLKIEGSKVTYQIDDIATTKEAKVINAAREIQLTKKQKEQAKIKKLNEQIKKKGLRWTAGETSVSKLSYAEKKKLFTNPDRSPVDKLPNLQGFEYYKGGVFEILSDQPQNQLALEQASELPESWDWRNVHGENWNTSIGNQGGASTCWAFGRIGAMESTINLYFNQHLNIDLSEQMLVDCALENERPIGMGIGGYPECLGENDCYPGHYYCLLSIHGVPDENCDPYTARDTAQTSEEANCNFDYICTDWQSRIWKNTSFHDYKYGSYVGGTPNCPNQSLDLSENEFKKALIQGGPMSSGLMHSTPAFPVHGMVLEGYKTDSQDNQTVWIFKNSWGVNWGEKGYAKIKTDLNHIKVGSIPLGPFIPPTDRSFWPAGFTNQINCVDKDDDGYCNWGVTEEKPNTCPEFCQSEKDCDDSNPALGPFDENLNCVRLTSPTPTLTPSPTPTSAPNTGNLDLRIRLPGIASGENKRQSLKVKLIKEAVVVKEETITITSDPVGTFHGLISNIPVGVYDIYLKGWAHLQKKISGISITPDNFIQDWATTPLIAGDFDNNNILDIFDLALLIQQYTDLEVPITPQNQIYDINLDNIINILDIAIALQGYTDLQVQGD